VACKKEADGINAANLFSAGALLLAVVFSALFLAGNGFFLGPAQMKDDSGTIEIFLEGIPLIEGENATARAYSSCGSFSLYLDGQGIGRGESHAQGFFVATEGRHTIEAKGEKCNASLAFIAEKRECLLGQEINCGEGECEGKKTCEGGRWGRCVLPKKVCLPGSRAGCNLDGCKFGYSTCNKCGSGFGPCLPKDNSSCG